MKLKSFVTLIAALTLTVALAGQDRANELRLQQAIDLLEAKGDVGRAIALLEEVSKSRDESIAARGLLYLGQVQERVAKETARRTYERIVRDYPRQAGIVEQARTRIDALVDAATDNRDGMGEGARRQVHPPAGIEDWGRVSPDGRWMSFNDTGFKGSGNLGVWDLRTGDRRLVTDAPCCEWSQGFSEVSVWSPDGRQLAVSWRAAQIELRIVSRDGGPARTVLAGSAAARAERKAGDISWIEPFEWSPDGRSILVGLGAFVSSGVVGRSELALVSAADGRITTLRELGPNYPDHARFSPDGRLIAYDYPGSRNGARDIFVMRADGTEARAIASDPVAHDTLLSWVDPRTLLFTSDRDGPRDAWTVTVADGNERPVLVRRSVGDRITSLGVTRDRLLYTEISHNLSDVLTVALDPTTGRAAGEPGPLARSQASMTRGHATWSPDGTRIAYFQTARSSGFSRGLVTQDMRGGGVRIYPLPVSNPERPVWRPDMAAILFNAEAANDAGGERIYQVDLVTGAVEPIAEGVQAAFSRDGRYVYYPKPPAPATLIRRDLSTGAEHTVTQAAGMARALAISPDGNLLATFVSGAVTLISTQDGSRRALAAAAPDGSRFSNPLCWSPDGKFVFVVARRPGVPWREGVWRIEISNGSAIDTGLELPGAVKRISVSPDGRLAISLARGSSELWAEPLDRLTGGQRTRR